MKYALYQIRDIYSDIYLTPYSLIRDKLDLELYDLVWAGDTDEINNGLMEDALEKIFIRFQCVDVDFPEGYKGRHVNASDIVVDLATNTMYYCDTISWTEIKGATGQLPPITNEFRKKVES